MVPKTKYVATSSDAEDTTTDVFQLYTVGMKLATRPITVELSLDGKPITMEVDTGAAVSLISERTHKALFPETKPKKSSIVLKTYTDERMPVIGELSVEVCYGKQCERLPLVIVAGDGPSLFGRNWLDYVQLDWKSIRAVTTSETKSLSLQQVMRSHEEVFKEELGTVRSLQAKLHVRPDAHPQFCKARPIPFSIKDAIELELDRLESSGVITKVTHSEWAAPIVPVPKKDGRFRICGDFKVSINPALDVDQPKPEDLFATLAGGAKFTKLDLSQAYQQLTLHKDSMQYVTINTHRGLYRYNRPPFGISSAPATFQKLMAFKGFLESFATLMTSSSLEEMMKSTSPPFLLCCNVCRSMAFASSVRNASFYNAQWNISDIASIPKASMQSPASCKPLLRLPHLRMCKS